MKGPRQVLIPGEGQRRLGPFSALAQESANQDKQARGVAMRRFEVVYSVLDRDKGYRIIRRYFSRDPNAARIRARFRENSWWDMRVHSVQEIPTVVKK